MISCPFYLSFHHHSSPTSSVAPFFTLQHFLHTFFCTSVLFIHLSPSLLSATFFPISLICTLYHCSSTHFIATAEDSLHFPHILASEKDGIHFPCNPGVAHWVLLKDERNWLSFIGSYCSILLHCVFELRVLTPCF
jgi:hypothetical protein